MVGFFANNVKCQQDETIAKLSQLCKYLFLSNVLLAVAVIVGFKRVFFFFLMFREQALNQLASSQVLATAACSNNRDFKIYDAMAATTPQNLHI